MPAGRLPTQLEERLLKLLLARQHLRGKDDELREAGNEIELLMSAIKLIG